MKQAVRKVPGLRFPGFEGEWVEKRLGHVAKIKHGKSQKEVEVKDGEYPILGTGGEIGRTNTPLYDKPSVLIGRKGTIDKPVYMESPFWTVDTLFYTEISQTAIPSFVYNRFQKIYWKKYNEGSGVPSLSASTISSIKLLIPTLKEQEMIASFLAVVDERIGAMDKKLELLKKYKKGIMQKIFTQQISFKDKNNKDFPDWVNQKLGKVFDRVTRKNKQNNLNVLTISAQQGLINQEDFFNKSVAAKNLTNYYLLKRDEFAYNKSYSKGYPMGAIKKLNNYSSGVVSTLYICFSIKVANSKEFFEQYFEFGIQNQEIAKIAQEGARNHGLLNIGVTDFFNSITLKVPSPGEQSRIANFLTSIDDKIKEEERQLDQAKQFKKALLQQMFV